MGALEGNSETMDVWAKNIRLGSANLSITNAASIAADEEISMGDFYYRGSNRGTLDIRAARQAGTIESLGMYKGQMAFTIAEGDIRANYVNIESGGFTLTAQTGSLLVDTMHAVDIAGAYGIELHAGLDIGSRETPLKFVFTRQWIAEDSTEDFFWTRDLYLDYDRPMNTPLTLNKQGEGNIYLTIRGRDVEIAQEGVLGGVIDASGQNVSITTTAGGIGTQEAPLVIEAARALTLTSAGGHLGAWRRRQPAP